jgi:hypothetical protein
MTALLTTVGATHIGQLVAGTATTHAFDALELGHAAGVAPDVGDDRSDLTTKIGGSLIQVASGYPVLGDSNIRNDGRGATIYTWAFVYPEGAQIIASNAIVTNYDAGAPSGTEAVMVHAAESLVKRGDQILTVFVNVSQALAATLVAHVEDGAPLVEQVATWRSQSIALSGAPGATPVSNGVVQSKLNEGEQAWLGARMLGPEGGVLTRDDVSSIRLTALKRDREREWTVALEAALDVFGTMPAAPTRTDPRWRGSAGYTFAHAWLPPSGWGSRRTRLEYAFTLLDGTTRTLVHEIEWLSVRSL